MPWLRGMIHVGSDDEIVSRGKLHRLKRCRIAALHELRGLDQLPLVYSTRIRAAPNVLDLRPFDIYSASQSTCYSTTTMWKARVIERRRSS